MAARFPISGRTRVVGIIGDPVDHSRSPAMQMRHLRPSPPTGFRGASSRVREAVQAVRALGLAGVNVTVPHKEAVLPYLDALSPLARQLGAVNTIANRSGRLYGDNTDAAGFLHTLHQHQPSLRHRHAIVIGAGGSARAVLAGLARAHIGRVTLANRTPARARALARRWRGAAMAIRPISLAALTDPARLADAAVIVNATSVGLSRTPFPPLAYAATPRDCLFYDLLYGRESEFLRRARRAGRTVLDGTEMLVQQGACAFTLWTRRRAPIPIMRAAILGKS
jgi:shikimate dehydrogenase